MNPKAPKTTEEQIAPPKTEKLPYEPPQAAFIPLKLEERLLSCVKVAEPAYTIV